MRDVIDRVARDEGVDCSLDILVPETDGGDYKHTRVLS